MYVPFLWKRTRFDAGALSGSRHDSVEVMCSWPPLVWAWAGRRVLKGQLWCSALERSCQETREAELPLHPPAPGPRSLLAPRLCHHDRCPGRSRRKSGRQRVRTPASARRCGEVACGQAYARGHASCQDQHYTERGMRQGLALVIWAKATERDPG